MDFATHFWHEIPIPHHNRNDPYMSNLSTSPNAPRRWQRPRLPKAHKVIRERLREDGISDEIDDVARQVLPDYAK